MIILGIETSCDETAAAVLKNGVILSSVVHTQDEHKYFGGVVPQIAAKNHEKLIINVVDKALKKSKIKLNNLSAVAVTCGPGLVGSLLVGINFSLGMSLGLKIPIYGINHLEGHLVSNLINKTSFHYPYICLLVSGGHTQII